MLNVSDLIQKYDVPVPRYTSYPAIPNWQNNVDTAGWIENLRKSFSQQRSSWSIYIHLPFCESLCTFCACNNVITRNHEKESDYIRAIQKEWAWYVEQIPQISNAPLKQIHLGGGTPTFFSPEHLKEMLSPIFFQVHREAGDFEGAIEVDPRRYRREHLEVLRSLGFNRVSLGVQDFSEHVQHFINRYQPYEMVEECIKEARELGYRSTNFDLIYGLPGQTETSIQETAEKVVRLLPERIALYSLAVVPWLKPAQRRFQEKDLPRGPAKRDLYETARGVFLMAGYIEIGIDHFALPRDSMAKSFSAGTLHRNFMGYTEYETDVLLGLGASSISSTSECFRQNQKELGTYYDHLEKSDFTALRTHWLSGEDRLVARQILELLTKRRTTVESSDALDKRLGSMIKDGLIELKQNHLVVTNRGQPFIRNICAGLDRYLPPQKQVHNYSTGV